MWNWLKEISTVIIVPLAILYFFGFICVNAYLARFGIVSFEAINARFILAGIYPLISLAVVIFFGWTLYRELPFSKLWETKSWKLRLFRHVEFLGYCITGSFVLSLLMKIGAYTPRADISAMKFRSFFNYDFIGEEISRIPSFFSLETNYVLKVLLYIFSYAIVVLLVIVLLILIFKWMRQLWSRSEKTTSTEKTEEAPAQLRETQKEDDEYRTIPFFLILLLDLFITSLYLTLIFYSGIKISSELLDFHSITKDETISQSLIFAWLFTSTVIVYFFLISLEIPADQLRLKFAEKISNFGTMQWAVQQLIVPIIGSLFIFGATIFPKIPFAIGGGEPREVKITLLDGQSSLTSDKLYLIGENNQFFYVIGTNAVGEQGRALQINKSSVRFIEIKSATST